MATKTQHLHGITLSKLECRFRGFLPLVYFEVQEYSSPRFPVFFLVVSSSSKPVSCRDPGLRWHSLGGNDDHIATLPQNPFA